jgi:type IV pilus assembly protein PilB
MTDELNFEPQTETEPIKGGGGGFGGGRPPRRTRVGTGGDDEEELRDRVLKIYQMLKMFTGTTPSAQEVARAAQLSEKKVNTIMDYLSRRLGAVAEGLSGEFAHRYYLSLAVESGLITAQEASLAQKESRDTGDSIASVLAKWGLAGDLEDKSRLELRYGVDFVKLNNIEVELDCLNKLPESFVLSKLAVAVNWSAYQVTVAMVTPDDKWAVDQIRHVYLKGKKVRLVVCTERSFQEFVETVYRPYKDGKLEGAHPPDPDMNWPQAAGHSLPEEIADAESLKLIASSEFYPESERVVDFQKEALMPAIMRLANHILRKAISDSVSDVHIEPGAQDVKVRCRKDGALYIDRILPKRMAVPLACRFKIMANLDSSDQLAIQEGSILVRLSGRNVDFGISVVPAKHGENIVLRINDTDTD